jgi:malate permease and related proteins
MIAIIALRIFATLILPVFLLIGVGLAADRRFRLDLPTLSGLCFHLLLPALIFIKVLGSNLDLARMGEIALATGVHTLALLALSFLLLGRGRRRPQQLVLSLGAAFYNAGNFGIPLAELAFPGTGAGVMAVIMTTQNLLTFSLGVYLIERRERTLGPIFLGLARTPVIHAILAAFLMRLFGLPLPAQLRQPLEYLAGGLIPVALITLGVQLSRSRLAQNLSPLLALASVRLLVSPLAAWAIVGLFPLPAPLSAIFVVAAGLPVAVNVYIVAAQYELDSALASQAIFWTTLLSAATLSALLAMVR